MAKAETHGTITADQIPFKLSDKPKEEVNKQHKTGVTKLLSKFIQHCISTYRTRNIHWRGYLEDNFTINVSLVQSRSDLSHTCISIFLCFNFNYIFGIFCRTVVFLYAGYIPEFDIRRVATSCFKSKMLAETYSILKDRKAIQNEPCLGRSSK